jgi:hypothetical protein
MSENDVDSLKVVGCTSMMMFAPVRWHIRDADEHSRSGRSDFGRLNCPLADC